MSDFVHGCLLSLYLMGFLIATLVAPHTHPIRKPIKNVILTYKRNILEGSDNLGAYTVLYTLKGF